MQGGFDEQVMLAAIGEPTRFRIVQALATSPRTVGEVAGLVDVRQPQATRHLQTLAAAGIVEVHVLGRRRVVALRREAVAQLAAWFTALTSAHPSESVLEQYERAIRVAQADLASGARFEPVVLERLVPARPESVWRAFTDAAEMSLWWAPPHLWVEECAVDAVVGGGLRVVLAEGDGARHVAHGSFLSLDPPRSLSFELTALTPNGTPALTTTHHLRLEGGVMTTRLTMSIVIAPQEPAAAEILGGVELGWGQILDGLVALFVSRQSEADDQG